MEVGTTNKTRISDYERAITERTALLLKVHQSNSRIVGFTEQVSLDEPVDLGRKHDLPVVEDLGSGALADVLRAPRKNRWCRKAFVQVPIWSVSAATNC